MSWWDNAFSWLKNYRNEDGFWTIFGREVNGAPQFNNYADEEKKINVVFSNPAILKVFCLQCDLFSLGKPYVYKDDKEVADDPVLNLFNNPNRRQSRSQFLWDFMFWNMMGTAYCYVHTDVVTASDNKLYMLDLRKIDFPMSLIKMGDKLMLSDASEKVLMDTIITYRYSDGTIIQFPLSRITTITDLTNGTGNWFKSESRIDALYKIISNSEASLDATNINTVYTGKFLVAGQSDPKKTDQLPLSKDEKEDIESKMNGVKKVHAVKSMIEIKRFVEDMRALELGKSYLEAYFLIGSMYGIPRDVLEAYNSSTYENQEKARASHVSYTLQPKGNDFMEALSKRFGYDKQGKSIIIDWAHLPFMQVFEKDRALTEFTKTQSFTNLSKLGVDLAEINEFLDTDFKTGKYEPTNFNTTADQGNKEQKQSEN